MSGTTAESPTAPPAIRLLLLALLPLMGLLLYLDGQIYEADLVDLSGSAGTASPVLFPEQIAGLALSGQIRPFDADNLYEYINGHAEYYLSAGFQGLTVGEYGAGADGQPKIVINLYDMGGALNAFGVLVEEAGDQESVAIGTLGFRNDQGVNFIHGPYYVQVGLFDPATDAVAAATAVAERLAETVAGAELAFRFPELGEVQSTRFVNEYYRGMEFFNRVLERTFLREGEEIQAFVISGTAAETDQLERSITSFLEEDGIGFQAVERNGLRFIEVEDPYEGEWFFLPLERQLVGVYAPLDEGMAGMLADFAAIKPSDSAGARSDLR